MNVEYYYSVSSDEIDFTLNFPKVKPGKGSIIVVAEAENEYGDKKYIWGEIEINFENKSPNCEGFDFSEDKLIVNTIATGGVKVKLKADPGISEHYEKLRGIIWGEFKGIKTHEDEVDFRDLVKGYDYTVPRDWFEGKYVTGKIYVEVKGIPKLGKEGILEEEVCTTSLSKDAYVIFEWPEKKSTKGEIIVDEDGNADLRLK